MWLFSKASHGGSETHAHSYFYPHTRSLAWALCEMLPEEPSSLLPLVPSSQSSGLVGAGLPSTCLLRCSSEYENKTKGEGRKEGKTEKANSSEKLGQVNRQFLKYESVSSYNTHMATIFVVNYFCCCTGSLPKYYSYSSISYNDYYSYQKGEKSRAILTF